MIPDDDRCDCCGWHIYYDCMPCETCGGCTQCLNCTGNEGNCAHCDGLEPITADELRQAVEHIQQLSTISDETTNRR